MADRLAYLRHQPRRILDAGTGLAHSFPLLRRHYPKAELVGLDSSANLLRKARGDRSLLERLRARLSLDVSHLVCADFARAPIGSSSIGLVWSNLALAWAMDAPAVIREFHRMLEAGGLLMFSTYGPDTLKELRDAFRKCDEYAHVHPCIDMHDLGDMLASSGFATPVMDMETITLTYAGVPALLDDLRRSGKVNVAAARRRGLMGRTGWQRMLDDYSGRTVDGRTQATVEVVYGHAWKAEPRPVASVAKRVHFERGPKLPRQ
ncbi:MAG: methyltransferase domain-containing protein [Betaproteobacteria bacterium]|nr:methyltransferase domain-containing protein [Betaproteobacteria bacterium]